MPAVALWLAMTALSPGADTQPAPEDVAFFEKKVRPLLVERCHSCHSTQAKKKRGGLLLDARTAILTGGDSGPALMPSKPEESLLVKAVRNTDAMLHMPPTGKLGPGEIAILEEWVRRGAPYPGPAATTAKAGINLAEGRKFWSLQKPKLIAPPTLKNPGWARRRIDLFLQAEMVKQGLHPSPAAEPRELARRIYFDLVGLPPTPEEVEAFVKDIRPDAVERLVDRLLASPTHGERWGRFWLDMTRYRDIGEEWADVKAPAWVYRDWTVRAFNEDLPYDQFVIKQLAADMLPDADPRDRAALGLIGLSPTYWKELQLDSDVIKAVVADEWEERITTLGSMFLGMTIACARCHDHKFDPITQADYYAIAGVLASTRLTDRPLLADAAVEPARKARQQTAELEQEIDKLKKTKPQPPQADQRIAEMSAKVKVLRQTPLFDYPAAPAVDEASLTVLPDGPNRTKLVYQPAQAQNVAMHIRGNPANLGSIVPRRFLSVLSPETPRPFTQGSGRLELAKALVTEGAPLTARVIVNRVWKHHFGAGIVDTPSEFGAQGSRPTHPELLDDLTARFIAEGWSLKWLHREIVLSAAYRQTSFASKNQTNAASGARSAQAVDPDNRFLWRANRRKLEIEAWRDAMLAVGGSLEMRGGGAPAELSDPGNRRRTLYGSVKRRELHDLLRLHDFPDPTIHSPTRLPTTTALQQLFVLNSPFIQQQSTILAQRLQKEMPAGNGERIQRAYQLLFGRAATDGQVKLGLEFLEGSKSPAEAEGLWRQYTQVLLGNNEFLYID